MLKKNSKVSIILATLVTAGGVLVAGLALYASSGIYPIGADVPHWKITYEALEFFRERAVKHHTEAVDVSVPADLDSPNHLRDGFAGYSVMCQSCHLKPGKSENEMHQGLYPKPPNFSNGKHVDDPQESFWIIKHGIKLSAMPAWGKSHSDDKLWDLVAFVGKLPGMSPAEYEAYEAHADRAVDRGHEDDGHHEEEDHEAGHDDETM